MSDAPMVLPAIPLMPPFPVDDDSDLLEWARIIHSSYRDMLTTTADRVENAVMIDTLVNIPVAVGRRQFFLDVDTNQLYLDVWDTATSTAEWIPVPDYGEKGVSGKTNYIDFNVDYEDGIVEGRQQWNSDDGTMEIGMPGGTVVGQLLQELLVKVKNTSGSTILNGSVVYLSGATSGKPIVALADASDYSKSGNIALATEGIADGQWGFCNIGVGYVRELNTSAHAPSTPLYLSAVTPGNLTATIPDAPNTNVQVGFVMAQHATEGSVYFFPAVRPRLTELSDVDHVAATVAGQYHIWDTTNSRYELAGAATPVPTIVTKTANYTIPAAPESVSADASGGGFTVTFPGAATNVGAICSVTKTNSPTNSVRVAGAGGDLISGQPYWDIIGQWDTLTAESTGVYWRIM